MKKIKVLQLPIANTKGGITSYALTNWKFIDRDRFQFDFATRSKNLSFADSLIQDGCKIHWLSCDSIENESKFITEINTILDEGYDAIHLHTSYWKGVLIEKIAMERNVPMVIVHAHSTYIDENDEKKRQQLLELHNEVKKVFCPNLATHFTACSHSAADWIFGEQIEKGEISILHNAINIKDYEFKGSVRQQYRKELGIDGCFVIGNIARFNYQKNHNFLIDIFADIYKKNNKVKLLLIGIGELQEQIKTKVHKLGLQDAVLFLDARNDVNHLLHAMDLFILPSRFEGFSIVLIEAQASGLPCIISSEVFNQSAEEINITGIVSHLSLQNKASDWAELALSFWEKSYNRLQLSKVVHKKGYDIHDQIKALEKLYFSK